MLVEVDQVKARGVKVEPGMKKPPWSNLSPGDPVWRAEGLSDDGQKPSCSILRSTVDICKGVVSPITCESPPCVLKLNKVKLLLMHPLPEDVKFIGAQGADVPAESLKPVLP